MDTWAQVGKLAEDMDVIKGDQGAANVVMNGGQSGGANALQL